MRNLRFAMCLGLAVVVLAAPSSLAAATIFVTTLTGAMEAPVPSGSPAIGNALVTLNGDMLTVHETFSGLIGGAAGAAHIHCCAPVGVATGVAVPFTGFPAGTSGTYDHTFDLTQLGTYTGTFVTFSGGTVALAESVLIAGLNGGQTYANIHDSQFPGGEIRGQLGPATVPEPATGLLLLGLAPLAALMRKRFHQR